MIVVRLSKIRIKSLEMNEDIILGQYQIKPLSGAKVHSMMKKNIYRYLNRDGMMLN